MRLYDIPNNTFESDESEEESSSEEDEDEADEEEEVRAEPNADAVENGMQFLHVVASICYSLICNRQHLNQKYQKPQRKHGNRVKFNVNFSGFMHSRTVNALSSFIQHTIVNFVMILL